MRLKIHRPQGHPGSNPGGATHRAANAPSARGKLAVQIGLLGALVVAGLLVSRSACDGSSSGPPGGGSGAPKRVSDCRPGHIEILADLMNCRMTPFSKGQLSEAEFRDTLAKLRELSPDPSWDSGDDGWPQIVDGMLMEKRYMSSCKQCHKAYIETYRKKFHDRKIGPL